MAGNVAELTLILKAQNLATGALNDVKTSLGGIGVKAKTVAADMVSAFKGMGFLIASELANLGADILAGKDIKGDMIGLGVTLAGTIVYGLSITFVPAVIKLIAGVPAVKALIVAVTAAGATIGSGLSAAIAAGMAALPYIIAGVLIGAVTYAVTEAAKKAPIFTPQIGNPFIPQPGSNNPYAGMGPPHAAGGWAGVHGPEFILTGERGPEFVRKAGTGTGDSGGGEGFRIMGVSEKQIIDMVDRGMYFRLQRAAPTPNRT